MAYSVLFVCLGNICRSPMAEALFRHRVQEAGLSDQITVDSAGTGDWHIGHPPHEGTRGILDRKGISYSGMVARQVTPEDGQKVDLIVVMDAKNEGDLRSIVGPNTHAEVIRILEVMPEGGPAEVPDPYYSGDFEETYTLVSEACNRLLDLIVAKLA